MNKSPLEFMLSPEIDGETGSQYRTSILKRDVITELSSDFTLPDYYPEIRKLLRIDTNVSPGGRYIGGSSVEFSGRVDYEMIYVTSDGGMASAPLGTDFSFEVPLSKPDNAVDAFPVEATSDSTAENVMARVLSPRKVNIKCRLVSDVRGYCMAQYAVESDGEHSFERLTEEIMCSDSRRYMSEEISLSARVPCDTASMQVLYGRTDAKIKDIQASNGVLTVSGEAHLTVVCTDDGDVQRFGEVLPFVCDIETDMHGDSADQELWTAFPHVTETNVTVEDGGLSASVALICHGDLHRNSPLTVIRDIYSTDGEESVHTEELEYSSAVAVGGECVRVRGQIRPKNVQLTQESRVCDSGAAVKIDGCVYDGGKIILSGKCKISAAVMSSGELLTVEDELPIEIGVEAMQRPYGVLGCQCRGSAVGLECVLDGGEIKCSAEIYISYAVTDSKSVTAVKSADVKEKMNKMNGIIICYPASGETLWGISKKYHAPVSAVAVMNDLPMASMKNPLPSSMKYVIICK